ncbi:MAG TPA: hypothetical protein VGK54_19580 [Chloroflexota bacterium]|jgi:hypothetical protein
METDLGKMVVSRPPLKVAEAASKYEVAIPRLTDEQRDRGLQAIQKLTELRKGLAAKYGRSPQPGWELLNASRDERSRELAGE